VFIPRLNKYLKIMLIPMVIVPICMVSLWRSNTSMEPHVKASTGPVLEKSISAKVHRDEYGAFIRKLSTSSWNTTQVIADKHEIAEVVLNFAWRDQGRWNDLRTLFHPDGVIQITWYRGAFGGFVDASIRMAETIGSLVKHFFGMPRIVVKGSRAVSETDVVILSRGKIGPVEIDVTSYCRFYDLFEKRGGAWKVYQRTAIYEKDRIDPVYPSLLFWLAVKFTNFDKYPAQCRHLAYGLEKKGYPLQRGVVVNGSRAERELYRMGMDWLSGSK
jgi:hypothetical protein